MGSLVPFRPRPPADLPANASPDAVAFVTAVVVSVLQVMSTIRRPDVSEPAAFVRLDREDDRWTL